MQHNPGHKEKARINVYVNDIPGACLEAKWYQRVFCKSLTRYCWQKSPCPSSPPRFISCNSTSEGVQTDLHVYYPSGSFAKGRLVPRTQCDSFQKDNEIC